MNINSLPDIDSFLESIRAVVHNPPQNSGRKITIAAQLKSSPLTSGEKETIKNSRKNVNKNAVNRKKTQFLLIKVETKKTRRLKEIYTKIVYKSVGGLDFSEPGPLIG